RRSLGVGEDPRNRVRERLGHQRGVAEAPAGVVAGELGPLAEDLAGRRAERAGATRAAQPRDADTLARREASRPGPAALDLAHDLVAGDDRRSHERQVALDDVEVGAADTACGDPHADLAGARL